MAVTEYGEEDIDKIDWVERWEAEFLFAKYPGMKLARPSAAGYMLLDMPIPEDLL